MTAPALTAQRIAELRADSKARPTQAHATIRNGELLALLDEREAKQAALIDIIEMVNDGRAPIEILRRAYGVAITVVPSRSVP